MLGSGEASGERDLIVPTVPGSSSFAFERTDSCRRFKANIAGPKPDV